MNNSQAQARRNCDNCGKPFAIPPAATHKRFCCAACRDEWHQSRRQRAMRELREAEESEANTVGRLGGLHNDN